MIKRWVLRAGYSFVILGGLLFTPLFDLLPVDLFVWWHSRTLPAGNYAYLRVVHAEPSYTLQLVLIGAGLVLVLAGRLMGPRR